MKGRARVTVASLRDMKAAGEKIASLTAYDASFAALLDRAGVEVVLVGDSLGMVVQGRDSTIPVSMRDMIYHTANVSRGVDRALVVADMPFMSCASPEQALGNAARLMREGGAHVVKIEGGQWLCATVRRLAERGIPVCAHLGLLPQSVHKLGGYRVQGRSARDAEAMLDDARALERAGAALLVVESVPADLGAALSAALTIPVIGIGAGPRCDGQVLVLYDALGITPGGAPRFARDFLAGAGGVAEAVEAYVRAVKTGTFPADEHSFH